jgi:hypothetical protein
MRAGAPLFWLGISLWVGGLAALAVSAPVIFKLAPNRETAGLIFGGVLRSFSRVEIGCAAVAFAGLTLSWQRPMATVELVRAGLLVVMILLLIALQVWIVPAMEHLRPDMAGSEAARTRFQSLHRVSESLYKVNLLAGLALIVLSAVARKSNP